MQDELRLFQKLAPRLQKVLVVDPTPASVKLLTELLRAITGGAGQVWSAPNEAKAMQMVQIIDPHRETDHYWGDVAENLRAIDIWIGEVEYLGQGHGSVMMATALEFCYSDPDVTGVLIDPLASNARARKFYEQMGFEFVEYRTFGTDYCAVYQHTR